MLSRWGTTVGLLLSAGALWAAPAGAAGLPEGGPAVLHWPLATSPALQNTGIWHAPPILVSGASAYRDGEFLYQDFLYDDHGTGSAAYPSGAAYANDAADFVELRVRPLGDATAVRITYNTLLDPAVVGTTIALGSSSAARPWPFGAGASSPAQVFVTVHGETAAITDAASGAAIAADAPVKVDLPRRQVEVRIPHSVFDPTGQTAVRIAAGTGVWNAAANAYRQYSTGKALYNLAFRYDETKHPRGIPVATWYRDTGQSAALTSGDITKYAASIDFTKLAAKTDDDMPDQVGGVPVTGSMSRIYVTHFSDGQGRGTTTDNTAACEPPSCSRQFRGDLQPYWLHVPRKAPGRDGFGLAAYLHGCGNNANELFGSQVARELTERGPTSLAIAGGARGQCLWYQGAAMADLFEIWADVATRYPLDPDMTTLLGYSMGGYGTVRTSTLYPDVWGRAIAIHGCTSTGVANTSTDQLLSTLPSLRHIPLALWASVDDPLCQYEFIRQFRDDLDDRNYSFGMFTLANDHFTDITNDVLSPAIGFELGHSVVTDPAHVTYVSQPQHAYAQYGLNPDHAYWVSGVRNRAAGNGTVDVVSHGLGRGETAALPLQVSAGVLTGGELAPAIPYTAEIRSAGAAPLAASADQLDVTVTNIAALTIDPVRAGVSCDAKIVTTSDGPVTVTLAGCPAKP